MKMNKYGRRLLRLADELDKAEMNFDFAQFASECDEKGKLTCGSSGCALGLAASIPFFRRLGLRLVATGEGFFNRKVSLVLRKDLGRARAQDLYAPYYFGVRAGTEVFGVNADEYEFLFIPSDNNFAEMFGRCNPGSNASAHEVAEHIRFFVSQKYGKPSEGDGRDSQAP